MIVNYSKGRIELGDVITRKMSREYLELLDQNSSTDDKGNMILTPKAIEVASEYLVMELIERVIEVGADGVEKEISIDRKWLDALAEKDYMPIQEYVLDLFNSSRVRSKK